MFQPVVVGRGLAGWAFLQATVDRQSAAFASSSTVRADITRFRDAMADIDTAEALVNDSRALSVALTAFGLESDLPNKAFIRQVLDSDTGNPASLANRLADKRYLKLAAAFSFRADTAARGEPFLARIEDAYTERRFETAIGAATPELRLALSLDRELRAVATAPNTADGRWFAIMANRPLRQVFETALSLPSSVGALDVDRQLGLFKDAAQAQFGTDDVQRIAETGLEALRTRFLARDSLTGPGSAPEAAILTLFR